MKKAVAGSYVLAALMALCCLATVGLAVAKSAQASSTTAVTAYPNTFTGVPSVPTACSARTVSFTEPTKATTVSTCVHVGTRLVVRLAGSYPWIGPPVASSRQVLLPITTWKNGHGFISQFLAAQRGTAVVTALADPCRILPIVRFGGTTGPPPCSLPIEEFTVAVIVR